MHTTSTKPPLPSPLIVPEKKINEDLDLDGGVSSYHITAHRASSDFGTCGWTPIVPRIDRNKVVPARYPGSPFLHFLSFLF